MKILLLISYIFLIVIPFSCDKKNDKDNISFFIKNDPNLAIEKLNKKKDSIEKFHMLGVTYALLKKYDKSEKFYKKALKLDKKNVDIILNYSKLKAKQKNFKEALELIRKIKKKTANVKITLAQLYLLLNSPDRAIDALKDLNKEKLSLEQMKKIIYIYDQTKSRYLMAEMYEYYIDKNDNKDENLRIKYIIEKLRI